MTDAEGTSREIAQQAAIKRRMAVVRRGGDRPAWHHEFHDVVPVPLRESAAPSLRVRAGVRQRTKQSAAAQGTSWAVSLLGGHPRYVVWVQSRRVRTNTCTGEREKVSAMSVDFPVHVKPRAPRNPQWVRRAKPDVAFAATRVSSEMIPSRCAARPEVRRAQLFTVRSLHACAAIFIL
jgi:hypothetical protein